MTRLFRCGGGERADAACRARGRVPGFPGNIQ